MTNQFFSEELQLLKREENEPCVSIIARLQDLSADRKADKLHLEKVIKAASDEMMLTYPTEATSLIESINTLCNELEIDRAQEGIGFFLSPGFRYQTFFPFSV